MVVNKQKFRRLTYLLLVLDIREAKQGRFLVIILLLHKSYVSFSEDPSYFDGFGRRTRDPNVDLGVVVQGFGHPVVVVALVQGQGESSLLRIGLTDHQNSPQNREGHP